MAQIELFRITHLRLQKNRSAQRALTVKVLAGGAYKAICLAAGSANASVTSRVRKVAGISPMLGGSAGPIQLALLCRKTLQTVKVEILAAHLAVIF